MRSSLPTGLAILAVGLAACCASFATTESTALEVEALEQATEKARSENKHLLVAFLGEGWSVSCKKFKDNVLSRPEFETFANEKLVYLPVEARRKPKLTPEETAVLQSWVINFDIKSYPTLILIAPDGQELVRHGYRDMDAEEYIQLLQAILPPTRD